MCIRDSSYFDGCSYGGHMALMEAERYPNDYDAVIAGAPYLTNRTCLLYTSRCV